jgi:prepilin-type N-terminal cleavage/methylation domain-containing protein
MKSAQKGFTLIEIAIVLVIIGLLLGGVLKGQEMINSAKVKALAQEMRGVATMVYAYQDKFRAIPGDDKQANKHVGATATTQEGNGDAKITVAAAADWIGAATPVNTNEASLFWVHVRLAGLATGLATNGQQTNAVGGNLGITSTYPLGTYTGHSAGTYYVCSSGIDGKLANQLDVTMDDGSAMTGSMVAGTDAAPTTALTAEPVAGTTYTVCWSM